MHIDIAQELNKVVEESTEFLQKIGEADASLRPAPEKWSQKEILGHLLDSAVNNHHRFVRAQQVDELIFPKYEQEEWVKVQCYDASSWLELIELWRLYNRHLVQVIKHIPEEKLEVRCRIGPSEPVTLGYLVEDYLGHLKHHLKQIGVLR